MNPQESKNPENTLEVVIETDKCLAYHLLGMEDICPQASPFGIRVMMHRAGLTEKNDLVDITNLIMTEYGQPMHVFDAHKIVGSITVRMAKD